MLETLQKAIEEYKKKLAERKPPEELSAAQLAEINETIQSAYVEVIKLQTALNTQSQTVGAALAQCSFAQLMIDFAALTLAYTALRNQFLFYSVEIRGVLTCPSVGFKVADQKEKYRTVEIQVFERLLTTVQSFLASNSLPDDYTWAQVDGRLFSMCHTLLLTFKKSGSDPDLTGFPAEYSRFNDLYQAVQEPLQALLVAPAAVLPGPAAADTTAVAVTASSSASSTQLDAAGASVAGGGAFKPVTPPPHVSSDEESSSSTTTPPKSAAAAVAAIPPSPAPSTQSTASVTERKKAATAQATYAEKLKNLESLIRFFAEGKNWSNLNDTSLFKVAPVTNADKLINISAELAQPLAVGVIKAANHDDILGSCNLLKEKIEKMRALDKESGFSAKEQALALLQKYFNDADQLVELTQMNSSTLAAMGAAFGGGAQTKMRKVLDSQKALAEAAKKFSPVDDMGQYQQVLDAYTALKNKIETICNLGEERKKVLQALSQVASFRDNVTQNYATVDSAAPSTAQGNPPYQNYTTAKVAFNANVAAQLEAAESDRALKMAIQKEAAVLRQAERAVLLEKLKSLKTAYDISFDAYAKTPQYQQRLLSSSRPPSPDEQHEKTAFRTYTEAKEEFSALTQAINLDQSPLYDLLSDDQSLQTAVTDYALDIQRKEQTVALATLEHNLLQEIAGPAHDSDVDKAYLKQITKMQADNSSLAICFKAAAAHSLDVVYAARLKILETKLIALIKKQRVDAEENAADRNAYLAQINNMLQNPALASMAITSLNTVLQQIFEQFNQVRKPLVDSIAALKDKKADQSLFHKYEEYKRLYERYRQFFSAFEATQFVPDIPLAEKVKGVFSGAVLPQTPVSISAAIAAELSELSQLLSPVIAREDALRAVVVPEAEGGVDASGSASTNTAGAGAATDAGKSKKKKKASKQSSEGEAQQDTSPSRSSPSITSSASASPTSMPAQAFAALTLLPQLPETAVVMQSFQGFGIVFQPALLGMGNEEKAAFAKSTKKLHDLCAQLTDCAVQLPEAAVLEERLRVYREAYTARVNQVMKNADLWQYEATERAVSESIAKLSAIKAAREKAKALADEFNATATALHTELNGDADADATNLLTVFTKIDENYQKLCKLQAQYVAHVTDLACPLQSKEILASMQETTTQLADNVAAVSEIAQCARNYQVAIKDASKDYSARLALLEAFRKAYIKFFLPKSTQQAKSAEDVTAIVEKKMAKFNQLAIALLQAEFQRVQAVLLDKLKAVTDVETLRQVKGEYGAEAKKFALRAAKFYPEKPSPAELVQALASFNKALNEQFTQVCQLVFPPYVEACQRAAAALIAESKQKGRYNLQPFEKAGAAYQQAMQAYTSLCAEFSIAAADSPQFSAVQAECAAAETAYKIAQEWNAAAQEEFDAWCMVGAPRMPLVTQKKKKKKSAEPAKTTEQLAKEFDEKCTRLILDQHTQLTLDETLVQDYQTVCNQWETASDEDQKKLVLSSEVNNLNAYQAKYRKILYQVLLHYLNGSEKGVVQQFAAFNAKEGITPQSKARADALLAMEQSLPTVATSMTAVLHPDDCNMEKLLGAEKFVQFSQDVARVRAYAIAAAKQLRAKEITDELCRNVPADLFTAQVLDQYMAALSAQLDQAFVPTSFAQANVPTAAELAHFKEQAETAVLAVLKERLAQAIAQLSEQLTQQTKKFAAAETTEASLAADFAQADDAVNVYRVFIETVSRHFEPEIFSPMTQETLLEKATAAVTQLKEIAAEKVLDFAAKKVADEAIARGQAMLAQEMAAKQAATVAISKKLARIQAASDQTALVNATSHRLDTAFLIPEDLQTETATLIAQLQALRDIATPDAYQETVERIVLSYFTRIYSYCDAQSAVLHAPKAAIIQAQNFMLQCAAWTVLVDALNAVAGSYLPREFTSVKEKLHTTIQQTKLYITRVALATQLRVNQMPILLAAQSALPESKGAVIAQPTLLSAYNAACITEMMSTVHDCEPSVQAALLAEIKPDLETMLLALPAKLAVLQSGFCMTPHANEEAVNRAFDNISALLDNVLIFLQTLTATHLLINGQIAEFMAIVSIQKVITAEKASKLSALAETAALTARQTEELPLQETAVPSAASGQNDDDVSIAVTGAAPASVSSNDDEALQLTPVKAQPSIQSQVAALQFEQQRLEALAASLKQELQLLFETERLTRSQKGMSESGKKKIAEVKAAVEDASAVKEELRKLREELSPEERIALRPEPEFSPTAAKPASVTAFSQEPLAFTAAATVQSRLLQAAHRTDAEPMMAAADKQRVQLTQVRKALLEEELSQMQQCVALWQTELTQLQSAIPSPHHKFSRSAIKSATKKAAKAAKKTAGARQKLEQQIACAMSRIQVITATELPSATRQLEGHIAQTFVGSHSLALIPHDQTVLAATEPFRPVVAANDAQVVEPVSSTGSNASLTTLTSSDDARLRVTVGAAGGAADSDPTGGATKKVRFLFKSTPGSSGSNVMTLFQQGMERRWTEVAAQRRAVDTAAVVAALPQSQSVTSLAPATPPTVAPNDDTTPPIFPQFTYRFFDWYQGYFSTPDLTLGQAVGFWPLAAVAAVVATVSIVAALARFAWRTILSNAALLTVTAPGVSFMPLSNMAAETTSAPMLATLTTATVDTTSAVAVTSSRADMKSIASEEHEAQVEDQRSATVIAASSPYGLRR